MQLHCIAAYSDSRDAASGKIRCDFVSQPQDTGTIQGRLRSPTYTPNQLAALRRIESANANTTLGLREPTYPGFTDGDVERSERALTEVLGPYVDNAWDLVTWSGDRHTDHEACARATRRACTGTESRLLEYPIWMWHWTQPQDEDVPWARGRRFNLPAATASLKAHAVTAFTSQVEPLSDHPADAATFRGSS